MSEDASRACRQRMATTLDDLLVANVGDVRVRLERIRPRPKLQMRVRLGGTGEHAVGLTIRELDRKDPCNQIAPKAHSKAPAAGPDVVADPRPSKDLMNQLRRSKI